jgi:hypothetical protein
MNTEPNPAPAIVTPALACTLQPLIDNPAAALAPDPAHGIIRVTLTQRETLSADCFHLVSILRADSLILAASATHNPTLANTEGFTLIAATLDFHVAGRPMPFTVHLRPPVATIPQDEFATPILIQSLIRAGFLVPQSIYIPPKPAPLSPWHALHLVPGLLALQPEWQTLAGPKFPLLKKLCLRHVDWTVNRFTCPRDCGCRHVVLLDPNSTTAIARCHCQPPACPDIPLTLPDITPLQVNKSALASALRSAFGLSPHHAELPAHHTFQVGSWSADNVPVILTIQLDTGSFRSVIKELNSDLRRPYILLAPTATYLDANCQTLLAPYSAAFFALDTITILTDDGRLLPAQPPGELFARFTPEAEARVAPAAPKPRFVLRKGLGAWHLIFDGHEADLRHERGIFYVAWLLHNPPEDPIHALDLAAKIPEIYREQLGLGTLLDPGSGKTVALERAARIQERNLGLDDAQAARALARKERELEAILDSEDEAEPVKAEALRELEAIAEFQRRDGLAAKDGAARAVQALRKAITRFYDHLRAAVDLQGQPHPVLRPFADHIQKHILIPSARYSGHGGRHARAGLAGRFTYEPPNAVRWVP